MWLKTWFGTERAVIAVELLHQAHDAQLADVAQRVAQATGLALVAAGGVLMHVRSRKPLQDVLTATRLSSRWPNAASRLQPNAEAHLRSRQRLAALYPPEWLAATLRMAGRCAFSLDELRYEYPEEIVPAGHTPASWLRALTEAGAQRRFPQGMPGRVPRHARARAGADRAAAVRALLPDRGRHRALGARAGHPVPGPRQRGQLAGVLLPGRDRGRPAPRTLLFERFISAERNEPPDIDIDFEHQRREEVIQYIYRKYGRHRAALTAVVISYRPRSALRDVGRALGIDLDRIDAVAKVHALVRRPQGRARAPARERLRPRGAARASCGWS